MLWGWPCPDPWFCWPCFGTCLVGHRHLPHTHNDLHGGAGIFPSAPPPLLIRGGQEIAWVLGDKSIGYLAGGQRARVLPDGLLPISPGTGLEGDDCSRPGWALVWGDKCGTAACACSRQAWHCQLAALLGWRAAVGEKNEGGCVLLPTFCNGSCPNLCLNSHLAGGQGAGAGFAPCCGRWVPSVWAPCSPRGLFTNRRELAQGSRAPAGPGGL